MTLKLSHCLPIPRVLAGAFGVALACAMPLTAAAQAAGGMPGTNIARILIGSAVVIGLLFLTVRLIPRIGGVRSVERTAFRVVATLPIGQRERVVVVQVGEQQILLGVAPGRVNRLCELGEPLAEKPRAVAGGGSAPAQLWVERIMGRRA